MTELLEGSSFLETEPRGEEFREEEFTQYCKPLSYDFLGSAKHFYKS